MYKNNIILMALTIYAATATADNLPTAKVNGTTDQRHTITAFTHATIHVDADKVLQNATLLIENGQVLAVGQGQKIPENAQVHDYSGLHIYPGFVLMDSNLGLPKAPERPKFQYFGKETLHSTKPGAYNANEAIKASYNAVADFKIDKKQNQDLRKAGFTTVLSHQADGIMQGTSVLLNLRDDHPQLAIIKSQAAQNMSFDKGSSKQNYPISLMGSAALLRQTWLDAEWYPKQKQMLDLDLQAVNDNRNLPAIFSTKNWQQTLLADKIGKEFKLDFIIKTNGDSYQEAAAIAATKRALIVPLKQLKAPNVNDPLDAWNVDYKDLKAWQLNPFNPAVLQQQNITFALTPESKRAGQFLDDLRTAVQHGLTKPNALRAVTQIPAKMLQESRIGNLEQGAFANFLVTTGAIFDRQTVIAETWVSGVPHQVAGLPQLASGRYQLNFAGKQLPIKLIAKGKKITIKPQAKDDKTKYKVKLDGDFISITVMEHTPNAGDEPNEQADQPKPHRLSGLLKDGQVTALEQPWSMTYQAAIEQPEKPHKTKTIPEIPRPFSAYGLAKIARPSQILIKNATVWSNEQDGILEQTDVLVKDGKIQQIGKHLAAAGALEIDGTGKHLTSGIVDEHSHIALLSVNDIMTNSSMVRMQDVVNSHDVNIYRNLAGGVTTAQLLHGSANPIGGQSALVKMKWGVTPQQMLIKGADGFIKFALGENVKRSAAPQSIRYPLTRMGVEQVYRDNFTQAKAYQQAWQQYNQLSNSAKKTATPPRKDLAMEAMLEVIQQQRYISCHSYVQSEINMLMKVAEDFGFKVNTFTHILEGYKVADKMLQHGVGGSTFADWWAYKWEVNYAIPYNAAIMHDVGITTAINSDSAEMSRRLNQEAAKTIKYGDLSEQEAWKTVTLNPAKLLHLDDRVGSIKVGKDADLVLWSDNPLSIYAKPLKTMVEGVIYFDRDQQSALNQEILQQKQILIEQISKDPGEKQSGIPMPPKPLHCDSIIDHNHDHSHHGHSGE